MAEITVTESKEFVKLDSPAPLKNKIYKFRFIYVAVALLGAIWGAIGLGVEGMVAMCLVLLGITYSISYYLSIFYIRKISKTKYELPIPINAGQLSGLIVAPLMQYNMTVEMVDNILIKFGGIEYFIILKDGYFNISPRESILKQIFNKSYPRLYKKAVNAVPIIAFTIQDICKKQA